MARQGKDGKFVSGAGDLEDFAPELAMEKYWNTKFVDFTTGNPSNTPFPTRFPTGMEIEEAGDADEGVLGKKWVLKGAVWQPKSGGDGHQLLYTGQEMTVTLRYPATAGTTYPRSAREVIARSILTIMNQGTPVNVLGAAIAWPLALDILTPMPIFAEELEISAYTTDDDVGLRTMAHTMTLLYGWAPATMRDVIAGLQQTRNV